MNCMYDEHTIADANLIMTRRQSTSMWLHFSEVGVDHLNKFCVFVSSFFYLCCPLKATVAPLSVRLEDKHLDYVKKREINIRSIGRSNARRRAFKITWLFERQSINKARTPPTGHDRGVRPHFFQEFTRWPLISGAPSGIICSELIRMPIADIASAAAAVQRHRCLSPADRKSEWETHRLSGRQREGRRGTCTSAYRPSSGIDTIDWTGGSGLQRRVRTTGPRVTLWRIHSFFAHRHHYSGEFPALRLLLLLSLQAKPVNGLQQHFDNDTDRSAWSVCSERRSGNNWHLLASIRLDRNSIRIKSRILRSKDLVWKLLTSLFLLVCSFHVMISSVSFSQLKTSFESIAFFS